MGGQQQLEGRPLSLQGWLRSRTSSGAPARSAPEFRLRQSRTEQVQALWAGARNPQELVLGVRTTRDTALSLPLDVGELRMALGPLRK
jgi:hypothetical protein